MARYKAMDGIAALLSNTYTALAVSSCDSKRRRPDILRRSRQILVPNDMMTKEMETWWGHNVVCRLSCFNSPRCFDSPSSRAVRPGIDLLRYRRPVHVTEPLAISVLTCLSSSLSPPW